MGDIAAGATLVLDHDLLAPDFGQPARRDSRGGIRATPRRETDDEADDAVGPVRLCENRRRDRRGRQGGSPETQEFTTWKFHLLRSRAGTTSPSCKAAYRGR